MAFTGTATVVRVSEKVCRVTGLSLAASAAGTVSLFEGAGAVKLPDNFNPAPYEDLDLAESIEVSVWPVGTLSAAALRVSFVKAASPFLVTFTNDDGGNATPALEMYFRFH